MVETKYFQFWIFLERKAIRFKCNAFFVKIPLEFKAILFLSTLIFEVIFSLLNLKHFPREVLNKLKNKTLDIFVKNHKKAKSKIDMKIFF